MKLYAVARGNKTGVFDNWEETQEATKGYSDAKFKKVKTFEEGEQYINSFKPNAPTVNADRFNDLKKLEKPLMDFMYKYGNPHMTLIVTQRGAELVGAECFQPFELRD